MRRIASIFAAACVVAGTAVAGALPAAATSHHAGAPAASYYLSLGDSLAQGVQPNSQGVSVETTQGYPDQLYTALHLGNPTLTLVKLGCPGETTTTMIKGGICPYPKGSQLAQAAAFLAAHRGHVQLVTIDIGANDVDTCVALKNINKVAACVEKALPRAVRNLATIMRRLRAAGGRSVRIIGMSYYDPFLADWLSGKSGQEFATISVALTKVVNADLGAVYKKSGAGIADVFTAFRTSDMKHFMTLPAFGKVPVDVGLICSYTWMCAPAPVGPNIHANVLGYGVIANTFLDTYSRI
jgi:lysophospholipase L1-like esterase